jgi:hypothetical protein
MARAAATKLNDLRQTPQKILKLLTIGRRRRSFLKATNQSGATQIISQAERMLLILPSGVWWVFAIGNSRPPS